MMSLWKVSINEQEGLSLSALRSMFREGKKYQGKNEQSSGSSKRLLGCQVQECFNLAVTCSDILSLCQHAGTEKKHGAMEVRMQTERSQCYCSVSESHHVGRFPVCFAFEDGRGQGDSSQYLWERARPVLSQRNLARTNQ